MLANCEWHLWSTVLSAVREERFTLAQLAGPYHWNTEKKCALTMKPCRDTNRTLHWHKLELNALKSDKRPKRLYFLSQRLYIILYYYKILHHDHILFNAFFSSICLRWVNLRRMKGELRIPPGFFTSSSFLLTTCPKIFPVFFFFFSFSKLWWIISHHMNGDLTWELFEAKFFVFYEDKRIL